MSDAVTHAPASKERTKLALNEVSWRLAHILALAEIISESASDTNNPERFSALANAISDMCMAASDNMTRLLAPHTLSADPAD